LIKDVGNDNDEVPFFTLRRGEEECRVFDKDNNVEDEDEDEDEDDD